MNKQIYKSTCRHSKENIDKVDNCEDPENNMVQELSVNSWFA